MFVIVAVNRMPFVSACEPYVVDKALMIFSRLHFCSLRIILPDSIRDISRTWFTRDKSCLPAISILSKYFLTVSFSSICFFAMAVNPMTAFIGVRMSCDMLNKNVVLALLASRAAFNACESLRLASISLDFSVVMFLNKIIPLCTTFFFTSTGIYTMVMYSFFPLGCWLQNMTLGI